MDSLKAGLMLFIQTKVHLILVYLLVPYSLINSPVLLLTYAASMNELIMQSNEYTHQLPIPPKQVIIQGFSSSGNSSQVQSSPNSLKSSSLNHVIQVKPGERVSLLCSASPSDPPPRVKWFRKNTELLAGRYFAYFLFPRHIISWFAFDTCSYSSTLQLMD